MTCLFATAALWNQSPALAQDEKINVSGLIDWYYQYSFNHPPVGSIAGARAFDVKNDAFSFSLAEVNISRAPGGKSPVGFTATFTIGKTADIVHFTEPGGAETYKHLQQIYGTYVTSGERPITIDFGKFVTWFGYEVIESSLNDLHSRGLLFLYAIPFYHAGIRATMPLGAKTTLGVYVVNGWNNVEDDNGGKSLGASFNFKPNARWNIILNYLGGQEGGPTSPAPGFFGGIGYPTAQVLNTQLLDFIAIWSMTDKLKLAFNADYADASKSGAAGGHWSGWSLVGRYQLGEKSAAALRWDRFQDTNGLRSGTAQNISSLTGTYEYTLGSDLLSRLELRHDRAGTALFPSGGGGGRRQTTLTYSQVFKF